MVIRCHKIRLDPNLAQEEFFLKCVGTARFAFNWALAEWKEQYELGGKPSEGNLRRLLNHIKGDAFPWMEETPKAVVQQAVKNLGVAYVNLFKKRARFPKFKSKASARQSARLDNGPGTFGFDEKFVRLPKIGWVKTFEVLRWPEGRPISAVLRREGERWFLSVGVEIDQEERGESQALPSVGIDLGLTSALVLSTGEKFDAPKPLKAALAKLARLQRRLCRAVPGSNNRKKRKVAVARLHWRITQIRYDWQHKVTAGIAQRFGRVFVEDLNVKGLMANHCLARSIADVGWGGILRQLGYKTEVVAVGRWFASSKICGCCGEEIEDLPLNVRSWVCQKCGTVHDRDVNAARNILAEGERITAASCAVEACGEESSGSGCKAIVKLSSAKQESRKYQLMLN